MGLFPKVCPKDAEDHGGSLRGSRYFGYSPGGAAPDRQRPLASKTQGVRVQASHGGAHSLHPLISLSQNHRNRHQFLWRHSPSVGCTHNKQVSDPVSQPGVHCSLPDCNYIMIHVSTIFYAEATTNLRTASAISSSVEGEYSNRRNLIFTKYPRSCTLPRFEFLLIEAGFEPTTHNTYHSWKVSPTPSSPRRTSKRPTALRLPTGPEIP